jgi:hypothetical protein
MFSKIKLNKIYIFFIVVALLIVTFSVLRFKNKNDSEQISGSFLKNIEEGITDPESEINITAEREKWSTLISKLGGDGAYKEFKKQYSINIAGQQHSLAHLFGEILYEKIGINGIAVCDNNYGFGCFHGFFVSALSAKGSSILKDLDKACVERYGVGGSGCQHGLGHGLVEYYGHNLDGLNKSLNACENTTILGKKFGCTSGAFMEFNIIAPVTVKKTKLNKREFNENNPYFPCNKVEDKFQESCYFELGQFWKVTLDSDYKKIGNLCLGIKDETNMESCYLGIGHIIVPSVDYDVSKSVSTCQSMPDFNGRLLCISGVTWEMFSNEITRNQTKDACRTLPVDYLDQCLSKADFINHNGQTFNDL